MKPLLLCALATLATGVAHAQAQQDPYDPSYQPYDRSGYRGDYFGPRPGTVRARRSIAPFAEVYLVPELGFEFGAIDRPVYAGAVAIARSPAGRIGYTTAVASFTGGFRLGGVHFGGRYQGSYSSAYSYYNLQFHKLYAEMGYDWRRAFYVGSLFFDFGYAYLSSYYAGLHGLGGKAGLAFDFYVSRWFSIGPAASFDVQAFDSGARDPRGRQIWANTLGATFIVRFGFHL